MLYLVRHVETGRDAQPERRKLQRDLVATLTEAIPGARFQTGVGRLLVDAPHDVSPVIARTHGILSFSPCEYVARQELEHRVLAFAEARLEGVRTFAVRVKRAASSGQFSSQELAARLGELVGQRFPALLVDLKSPDLLIGLEIRGDKCWLYDSVVPGIDHRAAAVCVPAEPRFVADQMLGKLARWLRLFGFDTAEAPHAADSALLRLAREESRVLLTRDGPLAEATSAAVLYVRQEQPEAQLLELVDRLELTLARERLFTRCTVCNSELRTLSREQARERVPPRVYTAHTEFKHCESCDKLYWPGDHHTRILERFERIRRARAR